MRRPPASVLGDAADGAAAPPASQASGGAPPSLAGAKKSLGGTGSPSKLVIALRYRLDSRPDHLEVTRCRRDQLINTEHMP
eukprot:COSAG01_NODE_35108_length_536_cov_207.157895_1_plen_80_part_01